jgi:adenine/guanine phosphoribosyltransferase-like PRPP-binding protein
MNSILQSNFVSLDQPVPAQIVHAIQWIMDDFHGRRTSTVTGSGGRSFEFFPTAITDNIPPLHPDLSRAVCLLSRYHLQQVDQATLGVGEEDRGAMIISDILLYHNLPRTLARWTPTGAPGEIRVPLANEYIQEGSVSIYLNGVRPTDRIILIDDLISTGGTLVSLVKAIRRAGAEILEILTIGEKTENKGRARLLEETGLSVKTMLATTLEVGADGPRSKVVRVHLGNMPDELASEVAIAFPEGLCVPGYGD